MMLLSDKPDKDRICSLMYSNEMEPDLLRAVIYIHLEYHRNTYFNINLNLGYEAAIEKLRLEVANKIRKSRFMNTQDIVYVPDRNTILIIKSFINTENISRVYSALDAVCKDLVNILGGYSSFGFSISYGNFYRGVDELYMSWKEAYEMFKLGKASGSSNFYNLDNLLFEYISKHMESQIENKFVIPAVKKLTDGNGEVMLQLAENAEAYVDSCMSLSKASETLGIHRNTVFSRLKRFEDITGLKTSESFRDAFLTKLIAVYLKSEEYRKEDLI